MAKTPEEDCELAHVRLVGLDGHITDRNVEEIRIALVDVIDAVDKVIIRLKKIEDKLQQTS
jgi:hypothetical protein